MGIVFLAALVLGLGILALQVILPSGEAEGADHELGAESAADDHDLHAHDNPTDFLPIFLSLRFWTFGALAFGTVGSLIHFLGFAGPLISLPLSLAMGLGSGLLASWTIRTLTLNDANSASESGGAVGQVGRVLIPCSKDSRGKIRIELKGQTHDLVATTDDTELENGAYVLVEEMRGATAHVSRAPEAVVPKRET